MLDLILPAALLAGLLTGAFFWARYENDRTFWRTMRAFGSLTDAERSAVLKYQRHLDA